MIDASLDQPVLTCSDLVVRRGGRTVLDHVSLKLERSTVTGLFGPSGCGKTTLMRTVVGVQRVAAGSVTVLGLAAGDSRLRLRVAYTTQAPAMYADLTVEENFRYFASILRADGAAMGRVLRQVDLRGLERRLVSTLSGGQQARVSLGVALLGEPELLILDEPTVGLDPLLRVELWSLFEELAAAGRTLVVSSHVLDEAQHCSTILMMRGGRIIASGAPHELCERTGTATIEDAFIAVVRRGRVTE